MSAPIPITIITDSRIAVADGVTDIGQTLVELVKFQELRPYLATLTTDGTAAQSGSGWQFRFQVGTAFAYNNNGTDTPSVVVANLDVSGFSIGGTDNNELSFSVDFNTDEFLDVITTPNLGRFVTARAELWGMAPGTSAWEILAQWTVRLEGAIFDTAQTPSSSANQYFTKDQIRQFIAVDSSTGDTWAMKAGVPINNLTGNSDWVGPPQ